MLPLPQGIGLDHIVEDLTPQLGGDLDTNTFSIDSVTPTELGYVHNVTSAIQDQIDALAGAIIFQGDWNASTNDPDLTTTPPTTGYYWRVSVAGSTSLDSITDWKVGDFPIKTATGWIKVDNTDQNIEGTTSATFTVDTDSALGKVIVSAQAGAADKTLTIQNAILTDNRIVTIPDATDTVVLINETQTITNKTIDGDDNTIQDLLYSTIKSTSRSGSDATLITGTKGTSGNLSQWNVDGDLIDSKTPPTGDIVGTTDTQNITNKIIYRNITTVNAATYDTLTSDDIISVTHTSTGAMTSLTLPTAQCVSGRTIVIKDGGFNAGTNNITVDTEGIETIDGLNTCVINGDGDSITLFSDGTNWLVI